MGRTLAKMKDGIGVGIMNNGDREKMWAGLGVTGQVGGEGRGIEVMI